MPQHHSSLGRTDVTDPVRVLAEHRHEIALALAVRLDHWERNQTAAAAAAHLESDQAVLAIGRLTRRSRPHGSAVRHMILAVAPVRPSPYCPWTSHRLLAASGQTCLGTLPVRVKTTRIALCPRSAVGSNMHGQPPPITAMPRSRP